MFLYINIELVNEQPIEKCLTLSYYFKKMTNVAISKKESSIGKFHKVRCISSMPPPLMFLLEVKFGLVKLEQYPILVLLALYFM